MVRLAILALICAPLACQRPASDGDNIPLVCAQPEAVSGEEIGLVELLNPNDNRAFVLRGVALGVDGKAALAQDIFVSAGRGVTFGRVRCKASDGGVTSFRIGEVDPNLTIPTSFRASDGRYSSYLDLYFKTGGRAEGRLSECQEHTFAGFVLKLRAGGASVRVFREPEGFYLMIERVNGEPFIYRAKVFFQQI